MCINTKFQNCWVGNHKSSFLRRNLTFLSVSGMASRTFFQSTICLNIKGRKATLCHQALTVVYVGFGAEKHHVCFCSCICEECFIITLFSTSRHGEPFGAAVHRDSRACLSGCEYCITTAGQDLSAGAGLDKLVLCGLGQMALLFVYSLNCVLKQQYESYYWQEEHQLLLGIVLVYDILKGAAWYYVCVELRKRPDDCCCVCSDCPPLSFEVTNWTLANTAKPCIHWFLPHTTSVPALMTFLQVTFHILKVPSLEHLSWMYTVKQLTTNSPMYSGSLFCAITERQFKLRLLCRNAYLLKYLKRAFVWDYLT